MIIHFQKVKIESCFFLSPLFPNSYKAFILSVRKP